MAAHSESSLVNKSNSASYSELAGPFDTGSQCSSWRRPEIGSFGGGLLRFPTEGCSTCELERRLRRSPTHGPVADVWIDMSAQVRTSTLNVLNEFPGVPNGIASAQVFPTAGGGDGGGDGGDDGGGGGDGGGTSGGQSPEL